MAWLGVDRKTTPPSVILQTYEIACYGFLKHEHFVMASISICSFNKLVSLFIYIRAGGNLWELRPTWRREREGAVSIYLCR